MARLLWSILCERAIVEERPRGLISLIDVLEEVRLPPPPNEDWKAKRMWVPVKMTLVNYWCRTKENVAEKVEARVRMIGPSKKVLATNTLDVDLQTNTRMRTLFVAPVFPFDGAGEYSFLTQVKAGTRWTNASRCSFRVKFVEQPKAIRH